MKHQKLSDALGEISDRYVSEAAKSKRSFPWGAAVAAVLALVILLGALIRPPQTPEKTTMEAAFDNKSHTISPGVGNTTTPPMQYDPATAPEEESYTPNKTGPVDAPDAADITVAPDSLTAKYALASPTLPLMASYPTTASSSSYTKWNNDQKAMHDQPKGYADSLRPYWNTLVPSLLAQGESKNVACSPVNIYMALAMLAECTDGQSRQQLLTLLNADNIYTLRSQAKDVWRGHYNNDGLSTSILGSSLWLEQGYTFLPDTVKLLAENYYASVFQGDLGSEEMNDVLQTWLNEQTSALLKDQVQDIKLDPDTVLALATTINYQVQWLNKFSEKNNTTAVFHGINGDSDETFMNTQLTYGPYFWSDHFGAICLSLEDGSDLWLFLPDEGYTPADIAGEAMEFLAQNPAGYESPYENKKNIKVNLSLPKFDIVSDLEIAPILQELGVTDIFNGAKADFSPILPQDDGGYISRVQHASRVAVNEDGVTAAAFTIIERCGAAPPPEEEVDFTLDRPFLFYIESRDRLPLFTGIVNEP